VALPHARTAAVDEILVAAGRSEKGIQFSSLKDPVRLIFVVATPRSQISGYLATVGALARMLRDAARLDQLLRCGTPSEFAALLPGV
jgi:mannitol/fructose-specific phosphotransferase system IIA component (Ntr-type)